MTAEATCAHCGARTIEPLPFRCGGIPYMLCETCYPAPSFRIGPDGPVSADGFIATKDGPVHVGDIAGVLDECRQERDGLLAACKAVVESWEHGDLAEAARMCQHAIENATSSATQPQGETT
jgi:hypothetical protein